MNSRLAFLVFAAAAATGVAACGSDGGGRHPEAGPAFRLIAPLSTATVTSRRPTLHWALGPSYDGVHIQICRDRACAVEVTSFDASGTSAAPSSDLPTGVSFWRATPHGGEAGAAPPTPTWELTVGALSAPVDTSWGTTLDVNGDGYADVVVGPHLYLGGPDGPATSPSATLTDPAGVTLPFQNPAASAGDVNGDGYADFMASNPSSFMNQEAAYVYLGSASGLPTSPSFALFGGGALAGGGDLNGDGYADIALADPGSGLAFVYLGSASGPSSSPDLTLTEPAGFAFYSIASAGDVNGDGYGDLLIGAVDTGAVPSAAADFAFVHLGSATGLSKTPLVVLTNPDGIALYGSSVACAGDVNGDGYADLLVGAPPSVGGYLGSANGPKATPSFVFRGGDTDFGSSATGMGDVNGDGYADFVIGVSSGLLVAVPVGPASANLYLGAAAGPSTTPTLILANPDSTGGTRPFRSSMIGGDVNGDGFSDFTTAVVGSRQFGYLYLGSASGLPSTPSATLD